MMLFYGIAHEEGLSPQLQAKCKHPEFEGKCGRTKNIYIRSGRMTKQENNMRKLLMEVIEMQRIICLNQGSGSAYDNLDKLLKEDWVIKDMQAVSSKDGACCFVWIEKVEKRPESIKL